MKNIGKVEGGAVEYKIKIGIPDEGPERETYKKAQEKWGVDLHKDNMVMVMGDTMHKGFRGDMEPDLLEHEKVHVKQQAQYDGSWQDWWDQYLEDPEFRIKQEVEAYRRQYEYLQEHMNDRNKRFSILVQLAQALSGPMYGEVIGMQDAMNAIKGMNYQLL